MNCKWQSRFSFRWLCEEAQVTPYRDRLVNGEHEAEETAEAEKPAEKKPAEKPKASKAYTRTTK